jgi:tetratricopeptide (TPR) repeat protein
MYRNALAFVIATALLVGVAPTASAEPMNLWFKKPAAQLLQDALALLAKGELQKADALFEQALAADPTQFQAALGRAQVAANSQRLDEADRMVASVLKARADRPEAHNMAGVVNLMKGRNDAALASFKKAVELRPTYVTPHMYIAALSRALGRHEDAIASYQKLNVVAPRLPMGYVGQAESLIILKRPEEAYKVLAAWKKADTTSVLPLQVAATVYLTRGENQKALAELQEALKRKPNDNDTIRIQGDVYTAAGDLKNARERYETAIKANPKNADAAVGLGNVYLRMGDTPRGLATFRGVLKVDPEHTVASNNVAWLLAEQKTELDEALRLAKQAVAIDTQYTDAHDTLGWVHYRRGEFSQAVEALKKAKALDAARPDIAGHLGLAYAKVGSRANAVTELKRALSSKAPLDNRQELEQTLADLQRTRS